MVTDHGGLSSPIDSESCHPLHQHGLRLCFYPQLRFRPRYGNGDFVLFYSLSRCCWVVMLFLLPCRWSDKHLDHWALHSDSPTSRLRDCRVGELAQLLLHWSGLPFYCGKCLGRPKVESMIFNDSIFVKMMYPCSCSCAFLQRLMTIFLNVWFLLFA